MEESHPLVLPLVSLSVLESCNRTHSDDSVEYFIRFPPSEIVSSVERFELRPRLAFVRRNACVKTVLLITCVARPTRISRYHEEFIVVRRNIILVEYESVYGRSLLRLRPRSRHLHVARQIVRRSFVLTDSDFYVTLAVAFREHSHYRIELAVRVLYEDGIGMSQIIGLVIGIDYRSIIKEIVVFRIETFGLILQIDKRNGVILTFADIAASCEYHKRYQHDRNHYYNFFTHNFLLIHIA